MAGMFSRFLDIFRSKANKALDKMEDPRDTLDLSYEKQLEQLQKVRRGVADVATARKRIELQAQGLQKQADKLQGQAKAALSQGNEDLAREALARRAALGEQLTELQTQHEQITAQEQKLVSMQARAGAIDELLASGALEDLSTPVDDIQKELDKVSSTSQVDNELAALKAELGTGAAADESA